MIIYGKNAILEYLKYNRDELKKIFIADKNYCELIKNKYKIEPILITTQQLNVLLKKNGLINVKHQNIAAEIRMRNIITLDKLIEQSNKIRQIILILDHINDQHNFGAIIRSAVFFGATGIIVDRNHQAPLNATVVKTSSGATAHLKFHFTDNLCETINFLKHNDFLVVATVLKSELAPSALPRDKSIALILGSEADGISKEILKTADYYTSIQGAKDNKLPALNVSVAAAILLYELSLLERAD